MKKTTSLIMVLVLILSMLWGCGQADGTVVTLDSSGKGKTTLPFLPINGKKTLCVSWKN